MTWLAAVAIRVSGRDCNLIAICHRRAANAAIYVQSLRQRQASRGYQPLPQRGTDRVQVRRAAFGNRRWDQG
jgi:hypothetical protein